ncbi:MAG: Glutamine amidotransferase, partial [uncultured Thiotrichaceae bacterium]
NFPQSVQDCDGWMMTGSKHGVYENLPWMLTLQALVRDIHTAGLPMAGICFGHQLIAEALGGKVEKSSKGWGVGLHDYSLTPQAPDWMQTKSGGFTLNAMHQDQISRLPEGTRVVASSAFCEYAALLYGDSIITFQGHPEFSTDYETDLLELRQLTGIPEERATLALQRLNQEGASEDGAVVSKWVVDFFHQHSPSGYEKW